jgi:hypothetical protein
VKSFNGVNSQHWEKAMDFKFQCLQDNKIWIFTPLSCDRKPMSCKWIYKIKYNVDGFMALWQAKHKAYLVAREFTQVESIDFNETFSLVTRM